MILNYNLVFEMKPQQYTSYQGSSSEDKSALLPKTRERPPSKIDFPAPVSPVIQVMPEEKRLPNLR